jgi:hypothetical protein
MPTNLDTAFHQIINTRSSYLLLREKLNNKESGIIILTDKNERYLLKQSHPAQSGYTREIKNENLEEMHKAITEAQAKTTQLLQDKISEIHAALLTLMQSYTKLTIEANNTTRENFKQLDIISAAIKELLAASDSLSSSTKPVENLSTIRTQVKIIDDSAAKSQDSWNKVFEIMKKLSSL